MVDTNNPKISAAANLAELTQKPFSWCKHCHFYYTNQNNSAIYLFFFQHDLLINPFTVTAVYLGLLGRARFLSRAVIISSSLNTNVASAGKYSLN